MNYGEPSNNIPPSLSDEGSHLPPTFPQPECSCEPSSLGNQASGSRSSLPYAQETLEPSFSQTLPQTFNSNQQPEVSDGPGTVDDHGVNVPTTVTNPVASSSTATSRGINVGTSVINVPAAAVSSEAANLNTSASQIRKHGAGIFGTGGRDPYSIRELYATPVVEEPGKVEAPPEEKKSMWSKISKFFAL